MPNDLKRRIEAFHELLRRQGVKSFTYVEGYDTFDVVADDDVDLIMILALLDGEHVNGNGPTIH